MRIHFSWQSAVLESHLEATTKLVLMVIGTYMNQHGSGAFPSYASIARDASLNRATVIRHVDIAVRAGWLQKQSRVRDVGDGGQVERDTNLYEISYPVVAQDDYPDSKSDHGGHPEQPPVVTQGDPNTPPTPPQLPPHSLESAFEIFWTAGLAKVGKKPAQQKFAAAIKKYRFDPLEFAQRLADDVKARIAAGQLGIDRLHPATYLNQERWNDEILPGERQAASKHTNFGEREYVGTPANSVDWLDDAN